LVSVFIKAVVKMGKKSNFITASVWVKLKNQRSYVTRLPPSKIALKTASEGIRVRDGRQVRRVGKKWVYYAQ